MGMGSLKNNLLCGFLMLFFVGVSSNTATATLLSCVEDNGRIVGLVAPQGDANDYLIDPDGTHFEKTSLVVVETSLSGTVLKTLELPPMYVGYLSDVGAIARRGNGFEVFINEKKNSNTYNMDGSIIRIDSDISEVSKIISVFRNENSGWYPYFSNGYWYHFSTAGYYLYKVSVGEERASNIRVGKFRRDEMALRYAIENMR